MHLHMHSPRWLRFGRMQLEKKKDPLFVPQYNVWHYPVYGRKPLLAKGVKLYSQTITQLSVNGENFIIATQAFDDLEF